MGLGAVGAGVAGAALGSAAGGKGGGPTPPTPVDPTAIVNAEAAANRVNQVTPTGSSTYSQGPNGSWTQTENLSPAQQAEYNQANYISQNSLGQLKTPTSLQYGVSPASLQTSVKNPGVPTSSLNLNGVSPVPQANNAAYNGAVNSVYNQAASRLNPQWNQQQTQLQTQLTDQGIPQGSDAWNKAMTQFSQQKNDAYTSAMNNAVTQGSQVENNLFNMGLQANQAGVSNALTSGNFANSAAQQQLAQELSTAGFGNSANQQMFQNSLSNANLNNENRLQMAQQLMQKAGLPSQFSNISLPGTQNLDVLGANSLSAQEQMSNYQNQVAQNSAKKGGAGSLAGTLGTAAILSDRRTKRDIKRVGTVRGIPIYSYRYAWEKSREMGVMAQDIERILPAAVISSAGLKRVDYAKLFA